MSQLPIDTNLIDADLISKEGGLPYGGLGSDVDKYLPSAIDAVLRFSPPVVKFGRAVTEDPQIGAQKNAKDEKVYLFRSAVNRNQDIRPDGEHKMLRTIWFNGITNMPVKFTPETS